jgi:hypothetical protein
MPCAPKPGVLNVLNLRQIKCRKPANIAPIVELNFYFSPTGLKFSNMREKANGAAWMFERDISWLLAATGGVVIGVVWNYAITLVFTWGSSSK